MISPADEAANLITAEAGWTILVGKQTATPDQQVAFFDTGGLAPNPKWAVDYVTIQALIRGAPNNYKDAWLKARAVRDKLLGVESYTASSGDRWVSLTCMGDVSHIGYDDRERPLFSVNFRIIIEPAVLGNREAL